MLLHGKAWKFGDDISTDHIVPGRYFHLRSDLPALAKHVLEGADPDFPAKVKQGDFIVGGKNFGLGSSREHAPTIIKLAGVSAVLARSFARIFFRNAINVGLPLLICDTARIEEGDGLTVDLEAGTIDIKEKGNTLQAQPLPEAMLRILEDGGLLAHIEKHRDFNF
jgi:3-isopropylmalate/(R)-2-methylmalate dehydratase small subunit